MPVTDPGTVEVLTISTNSAWDGSTFDYPFGKPATAAYGQNPSGRSGPGRVLPARWPAVPAGGNRSTEVHSGPVDPAEVGRNRPVDRLAAVLVLAFGGVLALSLAAFLFRRGSPLQLVVTVAILVLVVQTMRRAVRHLHR